MLFSDSEDNLSSDTQSFDMDDLYGSDSGIETFSLAPPSDAQVRMTSEQTVCNFPHYTHSGLLTFKQDSNIIPPFDRMEMNMQDTSLMLQALCEAPPWITLSNGEVVQELYSHASWTARIEGHSSPL
jgi:hypothetical protein